MVIVEVDCMQGRNQLILSGNKMVVICCCHLSTKYVFENFGEAISRLPPFWLRAWLLVFGVSSIYGFKGKSVSQQKFYVNILPP